MKEGIHFHRDNSTYESNVHVRTSYVVKNSKSREKGCVGRKRWQLRGVAAAPFIVPSLFAWPLIRPGSVCSIKTSVPFRRNVLGAGIGPLITASPFSWDNRGGWPLLDRKLPFEVDPTTRVASIGGGQETATLKEIAIADRCTINWLCAVISGKSLLPPGQDQGYCSS